MYVPGLQIPNKKGEDKPSGFSLVPVSRTPNLFLSRWQGVQQSESCSLGDLLKRTNFIQLPPFKTP
jgi:hypothetical protein